MSFRHLVGRQSKGSFLGRSYWVFQQQWIPGCATWHLTFHNGHRQVHALQYLYQNCPPNGFHTASWSSTPSRFSSSNTQNATCPSMQNVPSPHWWPSWPSPVWLYPPYFSLASRLPLLDCPNLKRNVPWDFHISLPVFSEFATDLFGNRSWSRVCSRAQFYWQSL